MWLRLFPGYGLIPRREGPDGLPPARAKASSDWTATMHGQSTSPVGALGVGEDSIDRPSGPRFMEGFGSLDWDPEWAEFVVWREKKAQGGKR